MCLYCYCQLSNNSDWLLICVQAPVHICTYIIIMAVNHAVDIPHQHNFVDYYNHVCYCMFYITIIPNGPHDYYSIMLCVVWDCNFIMCFSELHITYAYFCAVVCQVFHDIHNIVIN